MSVAMFTDSELDNIIYFGHLRSACGSIIHSGDDVTGDLDGDDGLDNEVVTVDLSKVPDNITQIVFLLNSYKKQDFADIPFASIRIYEGTPSRVDKIEATYNIANDASFKGKLGMLLGRLFRKDGGWDFEAMGHATEDARIEGLIKSYEQIYMR